jgi:hypothetical protein
MRTALSPEVMQQVPNPVPCRASPLTAAIAPFEQETHRTLKTSRRLVECPLTPPLVKFLGEPFRVRLIRIASDRP